MDSLRDKVELQFKEFESILKGNIAALRLAENSSVAGSRARELEDLRDQNRVLDANIDTLLENLLFWNRVKNSIEGLCKENVDERNNNVSRTSQNLKAGINKSEILRNGLGCKLLQLLEKAARLEEDVVEEIVCPVPEATTKVPMSRITFPVAEVGSKSKKSTKRFKKRILTRSLRGSGRGDLINPFKYHDCLLCTAGFYNDKDLRRHYEKKHRLTFGDAPLPSDKLQIECQQIDRQGESTKCSICGAQFKTSEDVVVHKSNHVKDNFKGKSCPICNQRFVLSEELENHVAVWH